MTDRLGPNGRTSDGGAGDQKTRVHREGIERIRAALASAIPFIGALVRKSRIVLHSELPSVAAVDENSVIHLRVDFFSLVFPEQVFILGHQALHAALRHPARMKLKENRLVYNLAADVVVNHLLGQLMDPPTWITSGRCLGLPQGWEKWSVEEVYEWLIKESQFSKRACGEDFLNFFKASDDGECLMRDLLEVFGEGGEVIQEGDPSLYGGEEKEMEWRWREAICQAESLAKQMGRLPAGVERYLDRLLKPQIPIRGLLRQCIRDGLGRTVVSTWTRESRKTQEMPGIKRFTTPTLWALVDTSGSIGEKELSLFLGTIQEFNALCDIRIICWDAEAYEPIELKRRSDILGRVMKRMRGGGGTTIIPALRMTLERMKGLNIVLILTDGYIYDWEEAEPYLRLLARKSLNSVILWTHREVKHPLWKSLQLSAS